MKKVFTLLFAVMFSVGVWAQAISVVSVGNACLEKNNFTSAKQIFKSNTLSPFIKSTETEVLVSLGDDGYTACMGSIKANSNKTIKEVSFLIGEYYQDRLLNDLTRLGYKCSSKRLEYVTLGNGASVPQSTYSKGVRRCLVRELDGGFMQIIFKRVTTKRKK